MTWKVLDLFCGAGGAARGLKDAWPDAEITGVDNRPQPRYPYTFVLADALRPPFDLRGFDFIWASPPCQAYSEATPVWARGKHPDLIADVRAMLEAAGKPFVIENVENARRHLRNPVKICGSMLGLPIWRHRYFEIHPHMFFLVPPCRHDRAPFVIRAGSHARKVMVPVLCSGGGDGRGRGRGDRRLQRPRGKVADIRVAMGIDWMVQGELTEAIPPAYSAFIARQIRRGP